MAPHYQDDQVTVWHGDCLDILPELGDNSIDSVVTDPPYGLDFMGKHWDIGAVAFDTTVWNHCLRVLKPGGHLLAFGGCRTWHRLACAVEDAGFEVRDSIAWLYGSGFPKSLDVSKAIDATQLHGGSNGGRIIRDEPATDTAKQWAGWGTALKPAHEPIVAARKPLSGTVAKNVQEYGTGALNIDACRMGTTEPPRKQIGGKTVLGVMNDDGWQPKPVEYESHAAGRWPPNVAIDGHTATEIDKQSGISKSSGGAGERSGRLGYGSNCTGTNLGDSAGGLGDSGGASRFFPTFKYEPKAPSSERPTADGVNHPTVKPLDLMRWLVRLVTPPGGLVLDPFAGSGTTAEAAIHEHMRAIVIERETDYLSLITARLVHKPMQLGFDFEPADQAW